MTLMASHHSDDQENEVSGIEPSYNELHNAYLELHGEYWHFLEHVQNKRK